MTKIHTLSPSERSEARLAANQRAKERRLHLKLTGKKEEDRRKRLRFKSLIGMKFNRLTVVSYSHLGNRRQHAWNCVCECGASKTVRGESLVSGKTKSCGCYNRDAIRQRRLTHGATSGRKTTPEYRAWLGMKARCTNPKLDSAEYYINKGIEVCPRWMNSFESFLEDMGLRPLLDMSLDRIDGTKGYFPENCRWGTGEQQANNQSRNRMLEFEGKTQSMAMWAKELGLNYYSLRGYIRRGLPVEIAFRKSSSKASQIRDVPPAQTERSGRSRPSGHSSTALESGAGT